MYNKDDSTAHAGKAHQESEINIGSLELSLDGDINPETVIKNSNGHAHGTPISHRPPPKPPPAASPDFDIVTQTRPRTPQPSPSLTRLLPSMSKQLTEMSDLFLAGCHDTTHYGTPGDVICSPRLPPKPPPVARRVLNLTIETRHKAHYLYPCLEGGLLPLALPMQAPTQAPTRSYLSKTQSCHLDAVGRHAPSPVLHETSLAVTMMITLQQPENTKI